MKEDCMEGRKEGRKVGRKEDNGVWKERRKVGREERTYQRKVGKKLEGSKEQEGPYMEGGKGRKAETFVRGGMKNEVRNARMEKKEMTTRGGRKRK